MLTYLRDDLGHDDRSGKVLARWMGDGLRACEAMLADRPATRLAFDDTPTLLDICLVPQRPSVARLGIDTAAMPRMRAVSAKRAAPCPPLPTRRRRVNPTRSAEA